MGKVVITGITGFVGGAMARAAAAAGHELVALVRPTSRREYLADLPIRWHSGDVTKPETLHGLLDGADGLIHAAGMLGQTGVPESRYFALHEQGTVNILAEAEKAGVSRILYVSSPGILGPISGPPAEETAPFAPTNSYERSKAAAEQAVQIFIRAGLPVIIVRPEFIYGPGDYHVLGLFQAVAKGRFFTIGGGQAHCHPTFIEDAVQGMMLAFTKGVVGEIYHIAGPTPVTFQELGRTIAAALNVPAPRYNIPHWLALAGAAGLEMVGKISGWRPPLSRSGVAFFTQNRHFSWQKAYHHLGYTPQYDLLQGVKTTIAWYRDRSLLENP